MAIDSKVVLQKIRDELQVSFQGQVVGKDLLENIEKEIRNRLVVENAPLYDLKIKNMGNGQIDVTAKVKPVMSPDFGLDFRWKTDRELKEEELAKESKLGATLYAR